MSAENLPDDDEPYVKRVVNKPEGVKQQLFSALRKNPLFENHDAALLDEIVDSMEKHTAEADEVRPPRCARPHPTPAATSVHRLARRAPPSRRCR